MTKTSTESSAKRQLTVLQNAIVDGLEDIKAQNIQIFDTSSLSPLFERVVVASAASTRQTKALAASVRDKIRDAGFAKPRTEGEENGEWIIVDCGSAVVHIMQPAIRDYYRLEEIWGEKPVKRKAARKTAGKKVPATQTDAQEAVSVAPATAKKTTARKTAAKKSAAGKTAAQTAPEKQARPARSTARKNATPAVAAGTAAPKTAAKKPAAKKSAAAPKTAQASARPAKRSSAKV